MAAEDEHHIQATITVETFEQTVGGVNHPFQFRMKGSIESYDGGIPFDVTSVHPKTLFQLLDEQLQVLCVRKVTEVKNMKEAAQNTK